MMDHGQFLLALSLLGTLVLALQETWAGSHSLRYFDTVWTGPELGEPRFVSVGYVDDEEFVRFDSHAPNPRAEPRTQWIEQVVQVDPEYWNQSTRDLRKNSELYRAMVETRSGHNQSQGGVHTLQSLKGCEVSPDGRLHRGFYRFAYDGQDYMTLDTKTWNWNFLNPEAEISKHPWVERNQTERVKAYLEVDCVKWLHKYLEMGQETLTRTDPPSVRVTHHTASDGEVTLRCRAQDFYPSEISLTWLRAGEEQLQDTEVIDTRPGGDGTFQKWAAVGVCPGQEGRYTCRVQHEGLAQPLILKWEPPFSSKWITVGVIAGILFLTTVLAGVLILRKENSDGDFASAVSVTT